MISITLPSLYQETLVVTLESIGQRSYGDIEAIVVSPFDPRHFGTLIQDTNSGDADRGGRYAKRSLIWVREMEPKGCAAAHSAAYAASTGEFIFPFADDLTLDDRWDFDLIEDFHEKEQGCEIFSLGLRHVDTPNVSAVFGRFYPCFPLMRRSAVEAVGGWLSGDYRYGLSDADLGLRVWSRGGRCEWSKVRAIRQQHCFHRNSASEIGLAKDTELLFDRWKGFADGYMPNSFNTAIRLVE